MSASSTRSLSQGVRSLVLSSTAPATHARTTVIARLASTSTSSSSSSSNSGPSSSPYARFRTPQLPPTAPLPSRAKPSSTAYYTGRPAYIDTLLELEQLTRETKRALEQAHLLPPNSSPPSLTSARQNLWAPVDQLQTILGTNLKAAQYRQILSRLSLLARYATLVNQLSSSASATPASVAGLLGQGGLVDKYNTTLEKFLNDNAKSNNLLAEKDSDRILWDSANRKVDSHGRAYSRGRRKESSAQVWIVRAKDDTVGQILINNVPINEYFTRTAEREAVTWPLKLTSNLSTYNVFALSRGGGKSGQAGAIAHAIANAIVAETGHNLPVEQGLPLKKYTRDILAKDGILKRDPRMVERKKTGLAKARKAFTWVKR
ncbi:LOW QUALITY PROTEIN: ribosomal protein S5 domain 2-like protein [Testicularia cyperi]|uniref:Small ribosomal subunit protein uS9m n=1 Tax=Testicularia cyperi TaxID=1882483 RepID=A0A317XPV6_9BASI|nr:LOW QUALITY PROTEIN: ribosomal protein S5 domain 2-like protein [Testicularia cyperi]